MIRYANKDDFETLKKYEHNVNESELKNSINSKRTLVMFNNNVFIGWLRFNLFWDNIPFINMLYFLEEYRGKGYGKQLMNHWVTKQLQ